MAQKLYPGKIRKPRKEAPVDLDTLGGGFLELPPARPSPATLMGNQNRRLDGAYMPSPSAVHSVSSPSPSGKI